MSYITSFGSGSGPITGIATITGNSGGAVSATGGGNITLVGSGGVSVAGSPGTNTLTISVSGTGLSWNEVTATSASMAVNSGYIANNAGLVTLTLPATASLGATIQVTGKGAGLWSIAQNAGQFINFGSLVTTTGVGGSLSSILQYDCVEITCITANTQWIVTSAQGNLTVV